MDEQLKTKLVGYLSTIERKMQAGADFVADETPQLIREWLQWMAIEHSIYALCFLTAALTLALTCRWAARVLTRESHRYIDSDSVIDASYGQSCQAGAVFFRVVLILAPLLLQIGTVYHAIAAAKPLVAPRVVIVEKVAELTGLGNKK